MSALDIFNCCPYRTKIGFPIKTSFLEVHWTSTFRSVLRYPFEIRIITHVGCPRRTIHERTTYGLILDGVMRQIVDRPRDSLRRFTARGVAQGDVQGATPYLASVEAGRGEGGGGHDSGITDLSITVGAMCLPIKPRQA